MRTLKSCWIALRTILLFSLIIADVLLVRQYFGDIAYVVAIVIVIMILCAWFRKQNDH